MADFLSLSLFCKREKQHLTSLRVQQNGIVQFLHSTVSDSRNINEISAVFCDFWIEPNFLPVPSLYAKLSELAPEFTVA